MLFISCTNPREQKWQEDIDYFPNILYQKHVDFDKIINKKVFQSDLNDLKKEVNRLMDYEIVLRLQSIVAKLHIAHTAVGTGNLGFNQLPIHTEIFDNGLYIIGISYSKMRYLKQRVDSVNGLPLDTVFRKLSAIVSFENEYWLNITCHA